MKKFIFCASLLAGLSIASCSNDLVENDLSTGRKRLSILKSYITKSEAVNLANTVYNDLIGQTNNYPIASLDVDYLTSLSEIGASYGTDTLAYIVNYPDEKGFVIVSRARIENPVLGFSDVGSFSSESSTPDVIGHDPEEDWSNFKKDFSKRIEEYMDVQKNLSSFPSGSGNAWNKLQHYGTKIKLKLNTCSPWNKYIVKKYPGKEAGQAAIATAIAMSHCRMITRYHNVSYYFKNIIKAIIDGQITGTLPGVPIPINPDSNLGFEYVKESYTYSEAVDSLAKVIYHIGEDIGMKYDTSDNDNQKKFSVNAHVLLKSLFNTSTVTYVSPEIKSFNFTDISQSVGGNNLAYVFSQNGYVWIVDSAEIQYDDDQNIKKSYLHCAWGLKGRFDGYYDADIFKTSEDTNPLTCQYFTICRNY